MVQSFPGKELCTFFCFLLLRSGGCEFSAESLVDCDGNRICQIQAAVKIARHGQSVEKVVKTIVEFLRQTVAFAAEDQKGSRFHRTIPVKFFCLCRKEVERGFSCESFKLFPGGMAHEIDMAPVIHSGAADVFVFQRKRNRLHKMQSAFRTAADAPDISGVLGNFRRDECDVIKWFRHFIYLISFSYFSENDSGKDIP